MNEFDKVGLYEHNAESYRKVREAFKENNVVGIVHATGTGKSYNALQLAYDNKDLKTLWLVPSNAIKEHILKTINDNPNLDMNRDFPNLELRIYPNLVKMNTEELAELDTDLLILDEFHHTGALVWGARVNTLIDTHPDIKVFGMTAYTVRDRGTSYERDMALDEGDELFSDNIVSRYDLCDAMIDGVLPKPVYKSSYIKLIDMTRELEERVKKLEASGRECSEYNKILNDVKKRIHEAPNLGEVVKQNVKKNGKYIYFCPPAGEEGTNDIETIKKEAMSWFKEIAGEDIVIYTSLSEMEDGGKSNRDAFYDDLDLEGNKVDNKLRVMFAINQYNEGVHAPNLDGVIMGRGTCSDIVFFEQLGRALSVSSGVKEKIKLYSTYSIERLRLICSQKNINYNYDMNKEELIEKLVAPVIIDLAGNIDFIKDLEDNLKDRIKEYQEKGLGTLSRGFLSDASFDLDTYEVELFNILMDLKNQTEMTWDDWYKLAEEYYEENGDLIVPRRFKTYGGLSLGSWIQRQKTAYENRNIPEAHRNRHIKPLTDEQVSKLEKIGMQFEKKEITDWDDWYKLAEEYYEEHGNLEVPSTFITSTGEKLGQWIYSQRKKNNNNKLSEQYKNRLLKIGMRFDNRINKFSWEEWYKLAEKYFNEHGHLNIPRSYMTKNGERLGDWIHRQRVSYVKGILIDEQVSKLEKIGMRFEKKETMTWNDWYKLAEEYFIEHGNLEVPSNYITSDGNALGHWVHNQRFLNKNNNLTNKQIFMLEEIGMRFEKKETMTWNDWYKLAEEYFVEHGNLEVPSNYITSDGNALGNWMHKQRQLNKIDRLTDKQISKLELIGMRFDNIRSSWDDWYELARQYFNEHGNLKVSKSYFIINENGKKFGLGCWIYEQRKKNKTDKLSDEQISKLESIGMIWDTKQNKADIENLCKDNNIDIKKNKDVTDHISSTEFKVKLSYLKDNGINIVNSDGLLHEIFSMSSMNMKLKYNVSLEDLVNMYNKEMNK